MSLYLYGLIDRPAAALAEALAGIEGVTGPLMAIDAGPAALVAGPHDGSELLPRRRSLKAHARALEDLATFGTVLPMRFGTTCEDPSELIGLARANEGAVGAEFARLSGRVELGLRVSFDRDAALACVMEVDASLRSARDALAARGGGGHFERVEMGRRVGEALEARRLASQKALLAALRPLVVDHVLRAPEADVEVLRLEVLVERSAREAFEAALEPAARACGFVPGAEPAIRVVGPVPPFNFTALTLAPGTERAA